MAGDMVMAVRWSMVAAVVCSLASLAQADEGPAKPADKKGPPFTISKETTYITEPLKENGFPDYAAALDQRLSQGVTPENNAFVAILKILGPAEIGEKVRPTLYRKLGIAPLPADGKYFVGSGDFEKSLTKEEDREAFRSQFDRVMQEPWSDADSPFVAKWLAANEKSLAELPGALDRPKYYAPLLLQDSNEALIAALLPYLSPVRDLSRAVVMRGMRHIQTGNPEKALADSMLIHRLARHSANGGFLIDYLVGVAIEGMAAKLDATIAHRGKLSAKQARAFAAELAKLPSLPLCAEKLEAERFMFLDAVSLLVRTGPRGLQTLGAMTERESPTNAAIDQLFRQSIDWDVALKLGNEAYDKFIAGAQLKDWDARRKGASKLFEDYEKQLQSDLHDPIDWLAAALDAKVRARKAGRFMGHTMVMLLLPALEAVFGAEERELVKRDLVQISFALAAYRAEEGKYPAELASLVPKYLEKLPLDRSTGKDYRIRYADGGYVLYGLGGNLKDDGGNVESSEDYLLEVK